MPETEAKADSPPVPSDALRVKIPVPAFKPHRWMVDVINDPARFKVVCWHRRARKTTMDLNTLITECAKNPSHVYGYIGPTYKQAKATVVRDPMMLHNYLPRQVLKKPFNESELFAEFTNDSLLVVKGSDKPDSIRGMNFNGVILDEWALQKPEIFNEILLPVLAQNKGWAMFSFTPKGKNHGWEFLRRGNLPEFPDWKSWILKASQSGLISADELKEAERVMGHDLYMQELECEFLEEVQSVFRGLRACLGGSFEEPIIGRRYVIGVDLGRHHDATVLSVGDVAKRHLCGYDRLTEAHWSLQKQRIAQLAKKYNGALVVIDSTGAGEPIYEDLEEMGVNVEPYSFSAPSKRALVDALRIAIADRLITIPPEAEQTIQELQEFEVTLGRRGQVYYSCPEGEGFFDDSVISLGLMVKGFKAEIYKPTQEDDSSDAAYNDAVDSIPPNMGFGG